RHPREGVALDELEPVGAEARAGEGESLGIDVEPGDLGAAAHDEVVGELAFSAADVQHALSRADTLDEEVVVAHEPVLGMDAAVELDREQVDPALQQVVEPIETEHGRAGLVAGRGGDPEAEERAEQRVDRAAPEQRVERAQQPPHRSASSSNSSRWRAIHCPASNRSTARARAAAERSSSRSASTLTASASAAGAGGWSRSQSSGAGTPIPASPPTSSGVPPLAE